MEYQEGPVEMVDRRDSVELVYTLPQGGKRKMAWFKNSGFRVT